MITSANISERLTGGKIKSLLVVDSWGGTHIECSCGSSYSERTFRDLQDGQSQVVFVDDEAQLVEERTCPICTCDIVATVEVV